VGATLVLFNHRLLPAELAELAARAAVSTMLADPGHAMIGAHHGCVAVPAEFVDQPCDRALFAPLDREEPQLVLFTSGTTGAAKAARLSARALAHAASAACERLALSERDAWLGCLPLDHVGGASLIYRAAVCGYRLRLVERFDAAQVDALVDDDAITGASVVPTMLHRLVDARAGRRWPAALRVLLTGGGPLDDGLAARAAALGVEPCQTYGLTECASQVCTLAPGEAAAHRGSAGRPLTGLEIAVRRDDGSPAAVGEPGVISVRGASLFSGYEERGRLTGPQRPDAWFATGDLGAIDAGGFLTVHCRRLDLIVSGGENVYPAEVERVLARHPAVREAAVCGIPGGEWGQTVAAALVARGTPPGDEVFARWLADELPAFKRPRRWSWVDQLPRTPLGKLARDRIVPLVE
jgi:o-succinylbenzoate---CoA ligase